jgi:hypothetical protein
MPSLTPAVKSPLPLRVGFDLDGVILYNPARLIRPFITGYKHHFLHRQSTKFYVPQKPLEQWLFRLFHKSSIFIAPGYHDIAPLVKSRQIEAYLITARFSFLKEDLARWLTKMHAQDIFTGIYFNEHDEQPHLFKSKLVQKLKLDIFIEDNFDIVSYLNLESPALKNHSDIFWIYNLFDAHKPYRYKYPTLKKAVDAIRTRLKI